jgi:carbon storage regulator
MLILSRRVGERIIIGDSIEVVVQSVSGERVTLGLAAPREVKILRAELEDFRNTPAEPVATGMQRINGHHSLNGASTTRRRWPR